MTLHVPYSFVPGTKARAEEVNANFNSVLEYIDSKADNDLSNLTQNGINTIKNSVCSRNVGEIICSITPLTDAGLHLLDGTLLLNNSTYGAFISYISSLTATYPDLFTTESNWQTSVETYGVCGKFVYDSTNNTLRLPKITGFVEATTDVTDLGDLIEQFVKLPNIKGRDAIAWDGVHNGCVNNASLCDGPFTNSNRLVLDSYLGGASGGYTASVERGVSFDASLCSSVYSGDGTNTKIQPQAVKILYYIVIANISKTEIQVDIDEIATDLNGKAGTDLSNINSTGKVKITDACAPSGTYVSSIFTSPVTSTVQTYTVPANGWIYISGFSQNNVAGSLFIEKNGTRIFQPGTAASSGIAIDFSFPVKKGNVITAVTNTTVQYSLDSLFEYAQGTI